jgi:hypothetical protein
MGDYFMIAREDAEVVAAHGTYGDGLHNIDAANVAYGTPLSELGRRYPKLTAFMEAAAAAGHWDDIATGLLPLLQSHRLHELRCAQELNAEGISGDAIFGLTCTISFLEVVEQIHLITAEHFTEAATLLDQPPQNPVGRRYAAAYRRIAARARAHAAEARLEYDEWVAKLWAHGDES